MPDQGDTLLNTVYQEVCSRLRAIDDFRTKLLGLLPLASGTGLLLLFRFKGKEWLEFENSFWAIGIFGILITVGLFLYEIRGIQRCNFLTDIGKLLENKMDITGQFNTPSFKVLGFIGNTTAAQVIYPAVLAGWTFLAVYKICVSVDHTAMALGFFSLLLGIPFAIKIRKKFNIVLHILGPIALAVGFYYIGLYVVGPFLIVKYHISTKTAVVLLVFLFGVLLIISLNLKDNMPPHEKARCEPKHGRDRSGIKVIKAYDCYNRGNVHRKNGEHDKAISEFSKAIAINPWFADAYNDRGLAYGKIGAHDEAISDFSKSIEINPNDRAYYSRGNVYRDKGQYDKAISDFSMAIALNPGFAGAYNNRG